MLGGKPEVELRWYRGRGDRKLLCNLVRLEMEAEIPMLLLLASVFCRSYTSPTNKNHAQ